MTAPENNPSQSTPYIERPVATAMLSALQAALATPAPSPVVFHGWGMGGVGKSTLARKAIAAWQGQGGVCAAVSFGLTAKIDTPIELMHTLHQALQDHFPQTPFLQRDVRKLRATADPFAQLYDQYFAAIHQLETVAANGQGSPSAEELGLVKTLLSQGLQAAGAGATMLGAPMAGRAVGHLGRSATDAVVDGAGLALKEVDRLRALLQQHQATKAKRELQALLLDPLPQLTAAFVETLKAWSRDKQPILLVLDTYEKVPNAVDDWLWRSLLGNTPLHELPVRLWIGGRHCLLRGEGWRKLNQDRDCVYEQSVERFDAAQTAAYLNAIGMANAGEISQIHGVTKGLPYYLDWIRRQILAGRELDFFQGNQEIVRLLLQGLNHTQLKIVQLAACCRWFDRPIIQALVAGQQLDFATAADEQHHCFSWLTQQTFVESVGRRWRLDDVARDVFRESLYSDDPQLFTSIHGQLADYFLTCCEEEVPPESAPPKQYLNPDWRSRRSDFLYYLPFSRHPKAHTQWISHLLEARHFREDALVQVPLDAIAAEADLGEHPFLTYGMRSFLQEIHPAVAHGWAVLQEDPIDYGYNLEKFGLTKAETDRAWQICLGKPESLDGLAKFAAYFYRSKRCADDQTFDWLQKAQRQAEAIAAIDEPEFSSGLFLWQLGNALFNLERYQDAIASYDQALDIKPDYHEAWHNRGSALGHLERYQDAIASYDQALDIKPDKHEAWDNRGVALRYSGQLAAAVDSVNKAIEINPTYASGYYNRSCLLALMGQVDAALADLQRAIELAPDQCCPLAKTDSDFDTIRADPRFQALINVSTG